MKKQPRKAKKSFHFSISERKFLLRLFDLVVAFVGLFIVSLGMDFHYFDADNDANNTLLITLAIYILLFGQIFELYNLEVANDKYLTLRSVLLTGFVATAFYVFTPIIAPVLPVNRYQIAYLFFAIVIPIILWRIFYIKVIFSPRFFKRIILIGSDEVIQDLLSIIKEKAPDNQVIGYMTTAPLKDEEFVYFDLKSTDIEQLVEENRITELVVDSFHDEEISKQLTPRLIGLFEKGYAITNSDSFKETLTSRVPETWLNESFYNNLSFSRSQQNRLYLYLHRFIDLICSLIGITFFVLLLPFILVGNLVGNRGGLFYTQERIGKGGKPFAIIKLRSMVTNAESGKAVWAKKNDTRITKFGKFLRKSRLDEVPQFFNVLKGEMSLIGPRPERPEFVEQLEAANAFYSIRHVIKPGLTGWAQVEYPYANTLEEQYTKLRYDLYYIKERNLLLDFKIVIKTISTVLFFRGT